MNAFGLNDAEQELIRGVLRRHRAVTAAKLFGSRAKGTAGPASDIDLALWGELPASLLARIAGELEELPLPYTFDVQAYNAVARKIMDEQKVAVDDLYSFALPQLAKIQQPVNVHFTAEGSKTLAKQVAASIEAALTRRQAATKH